MFPYLLKIGPLQLYTYGGMMALAFLSGILIMVHLGKSRGFDSNKMVDLGLYIMVAALVGSRVLYIFVNYKQYLDNPLDIFLVYKGGLVFYGGLAGGVAIVLWFIKKHQLPALEVLDILPIALVLGHSLGRVGCFLNGCCFGLETTGFLGVEFPATSLPYGQFGPGHHVHPVQLYSSFGNLMLFGLLFYLYKNHRTFPGKIVSIYLIVYPILRSINESFRGDIERGFIGPVSTSQAISILVFLSGIFLYRNLSQKTQQ